MKRLLLLAGLALGGCSATDYMVYEPDVAPTVPPPGDYAADLRTCQEVAYDLVYGSGELRQNLQTQAVAVPSGAALGAGVGAAVSALGVAGGAAAGAVVGVGVGRVVTVWSQYGRGSAIVQNCLRNKGWSVLG